MKTRKGLFISEILAAVNDAYTSKGYALGETLYARKTLYIQENTVQQRNPLRQRNPPALDTCLVTAMPLQAQAVNH